jgi:transcriptional regulator with XRE-family HTH domain
MDPRQELADLLRSRRARVSPESLGLTPGVRRRTPGLRREELAALAGISVDYYIRLEQGRGSHPSRSVLEAIARALRLDPDETRHLHALTVIGEPLRREHRRATDTVRAGTRRLLELLGHTPVFVLNPRMDVVAWNPLAAALLVDFDALPAARRNMVRLLFLDSAWRDLYVEWDVVALESVAHLRDASARHRDDPDLQALVGELSVKSEEFRQLWARHDVRQKSFGVKEFRHPEVGRLTLSYEALEITDNGQTLVTYAAEAGSPSAEALDLLAVLGTQTLTSDGSAQQNPALREWPAGSGHADDAGGRRAAEG